MEQHVWSDPVRIRELRENPWALDHLFRDALHPSRRGQHGRLSPCAGDVVVGLGFPDQRGGDRMKMRRPILIVVVLVTAAAVAVAIATRTGASERSQLSRLSNEGQSLVLRDDPLVRKIGVQHASLLALRNRRAIYLLETSRGTC